MTKKALLIGINYKKTNNELHGCINDIKNVNDFLINNCGYIQSNIKILSDESSILPTRENIEKNITWLVSNNLSGDTLVLHYSGHGSSIRDVTSDETDGCDEVIVPLDFQTKGFISDDWLFTNIVGKVNKGVNLWCFSDCCHSGTVLDLKYNYKSLCVLKPGKKINKSLYVPMDWTDNFAFSLEKSKDIIGNVYMFSGCRDNETSADAFIANISQGAFTYCLLEVLKKNIVKSSDGKSQKFNNGVMKLNIVLKDINCLLDINGYTQNSQLSICKSIDFERTLDL